MDTQPVTKIINLAPEDNKRLMNLCGHCDEHLHLIQKTLGVTLKFRGFECQIIGTPKQNKLTEKALLALYELTVTDPALTPNKIHLFLIALHSNGASMPADKLQSVRLRRATIQTRGNNQSLYLKQIESHDISFGIGPAGTGKTYLAVASAVHALETNRISKIILVRPIVEAGEKLGFLPGDLAQKVHPYLQPLYDALHEMLGIEVVAQYMEKGIIELVPLAYMRGRSLNDAFILLDEAQNTTREQMKMFLTRIGFNSRAIITGDISQIDLSNTRDSGLIHATEVLKDIPGIGFSHFETSDIVRHPLVQAIVEAYDRSAAQAEQFSHPK